MRLDATATGRARRVPRADRAAGPLRAGSRPASGRRAVPSTGRFVEGEIVTDSVGSWRFSPEGDGTARRLPGGARRERAGAGLRAAQGDRRPGVRVDAQHVRRRSSARSRTAPGASRLSAGLHDVADRPGRRSAACAPPRRPRTRRRCAREARPARPRRAVVGDVELAAARSRSSPLSRQRDARPAHSLPGPVSGRSRSARPSTRRRRRGCSTAPATPSVSVMKFMQWCMP